MKGLIFYMVLFQIVTGFAYPLQAQTLTWQCGAFDEEHQQWMITADYEYQAMNKAYEACKKESRVPTTCKKDSPDNCKVSFHGKSTLPLWRCTALDKAAHVWHSRLHRIRDQAIFSAKASCEQESSIPESCYVNELACEKVTDNEKPNL